MAVNASRSLNSELYLGECEGAVRTVGPNRGGEVETGTLNARQSLHADYGYGPMDRDYLESKKDSYMHGDEAIRR